MVGAGFIPARKGLLINIILGILDTLAHLILMGIPLTEKITS